MLRAQRFLRLSGHSEDAFFYATVSFLTLGLSGVLHAAIDLGHVSS
jgi:hypothetical protein